MQIKYLHKQIYQVNHHLCNQEMAGKEALLRLKKIKSWQKLKSQGAKDEDILELLGISRATIYNWQKAFYKNGILGLKPKSKRPNKVRISKIPLGIKQQVFHIRKAYPAWGKEKIAVILHTRGVKISASSVGRILGKYFKNNSLKKVSDIIGTHIKRRKRHFRKYAKKWKYGMKAKKLGELIQIDHMSVTTSANKQIKHFMATCPLTKITVSEAYNNANSQSGARFLEKIIKEMPYKLKSIQVDGGSEFMKHFEKLCENKKIKLFVLPPRKPEYNGCVERRNGSFRYEFYQIIDDSYDLASLRKNLTEFTSMYNRIRPHQSLDYLTPMQYYKQKYCEKTFKV
jgi:putative transposase